MNWINNLSIKAKLLASFGIVILMTVIIGLIAIYDLKQIEDQNTVMFEKITAPMSELADITNYFQRIRVNTRDIILANDQSEVNEYATRIYTYREKVDKLLISFESTIIRQEVKDLFKNFVNDYREYNLIADQLISLAKENRDEEGFRLLKDPKVAGLAKTSQEQLDQLIQKKYETAKATRQISDDLVSNAITFMIIFAVLSFAAASFVSLKLSKNISVSVNEIAGRMKSLKEVCIANLKQGSEQLARGDLNINIHTGTQPIEIKSNDELGMLAESVNQVITFTQATVASVENAVEKVKFLTDETSKIVKASMEGNLSVRGNGGMLEGAYKEIVEGLNKTVDTIAMPFNEANGVLKEMANGVFTVEMTGQYSGEYKKLKDSINLLLTTMNNALYEVSQAVHATASASSEISSSAEQMAAGAQEQSSQTSEVASAIEQMANTIIETSKNTGLAAEASAKAGQIARDGENIIQATVNGMNKIAEVVSRASMMVSELGKNSDQIGEIVQVIEDIADQTNLLALNAAIEAARAGEQGRGFAVVADEVRKLAERTTKATKEIGGMIKKIQSDTSNAVDSINEGTKEVEKGMELAQKSGDSLAEILKSTDSVIDIVNQVAAASEEQSSASEQISKNIEGINSVTQESAAGVQQIARATEDLSRLTVNLQELTSRFKIHAVNRGNNVSGNNNYRQSISKPEKAKFALEMDYN
ncbi:MAG: methyl-accepting chemotaxis protein [Syntrophothermus sp.]